MPKAKAPAATPHGVQRHLQLQHHSHTGRLLHRRHTSYRGLALIVGVAAVFMVGLNLLARATADTVDGFTYNVYARVPAPVPTEPAVITSPHDGDQVTKSSQLVSGTCPISNPQVIVVLMEDGAQNGSMACGNDGQFAFAVVLRPGVHTFVARTFTITNDSGPDSAPVTITYTEPAPVTSSAEAAIQAEAAHNPPLTLTIDEPFIVFGPGVAAVWSGTMSGGSLPYRVRIDWGDGTVKTYTVYKSGHQQFTHRYTNMNPHAITLRLTDNDGRGMLQQYAAVTPYRQPVAINAAPTTPLTLGLPGGNTPILGAYGAYLLLIAILGYVWIRFHPPHVYAKVPVAVRKRQTKGRR